MVLATKCMTRLAKVARRPDEAVVTGLPCGPSTLCASFDRALVRTQVSQPSCWRCSASLKASDASARRTEGSFPKLWTGDTIYWLLLLVTATHKWVLHSYTRY